MSFGGGSGIVENRGVAAAIEADTKATHAADDVFKPSGGGFVADALKLETAKTVPRYGWNTLGFKMSSMDFAEFAKAVASRESDAVENRRTLKGDLTAKTLYLEIDVPCDPNQSPAVESPVVESSQESVEG